MVTRKTPAVRIACSAAFLVLALALVPTALAGKGGKPSGGGTTGSSTISLAPVVLDVNTPGLSRGDTVTFNVTTTATDQPFVDLKCYQNGVLVLHGSAGYFPSALNFGYDFTLVSGGWAAGAANCTASLGMYNQKGNWQNLASTSFNVSG
jgi:hypothetical protein